MEQQELVERIEAYAAAKVSNNPRLLAFAVKALQDALLELYQPDTSKENKAKQPDTSKENKAK